MLSWSLQYRVLWSHSRPLRSFEVSLSHDEIVVSELQFNGDSSQAKNKPSTAPLRKSFHFIFHSDSFRCSGAIHLAGMLKPASSPSLINEILIFSIQFVLSDCLVAVYKLETIFAKDYQLEDHRQILARQLLLEWAGMTVWEVFNTLNRSVGLQDYYFEWDSCIVGEAWGTVTNYINL